MNTLLSRTWVLLILIASLATNHLCAQSTSEHRIALHITGFTSDERDGLSRELAKNGSARIAFACVPAGIIILEPLQQDLNIDSLRLRAMPGLLRSVAPSRISEDHITMERAEELCSNQREK